MKRVIIVTFGVILVFGLLTWVTYEDNAIVDSFTQIGFPFRFYIQTAGKLTDPGYASELGYFPKYLIYDILVLIVTVIIANMIITKLTKQRHNI